MANPEHLKTLKQEIEPWSKRRSEQLGWPPPRNSELESMHLVFANLRKAKLKQIVLCGAVLQSSDFSGADLRGANLSETDLLRANFNGADLSHAKLRNAKLGDTTYIETNLSYADLSHANLNSADLSRANLREADLTGAHLWGAHFNGANLQGADLKGADLRETEFTGADLTYAGIGYSIFDNNDLSTVKGLETVWHEGPTTVGIDTIYKSGGKIPEVFMRGCGVPDEFITYMHSLASHPIQFYSCFLSYSNKDQEFTERLYADLQNKSVRCWFAPEDLKIGDKMRDRIDESIRLRDKLLLILSEHSIASEWVEHEVESALEEEKQRGRTILFPIRVDDAVMESNKAWAALIRRTRNIGDFTRWKDHDSYQKSFDRLIRDLKAEESSKK